VQAKCSEPDLRRFAAPANEAVLRWAATREVAMPERALVGVVDVFCSAAVETAADRKLPDEAIGRVIDGVIASYLDLCVDATQPMKSMESLLNAALGASGLARPVPREFVRISLSLEGEPKQIRVGSEVMPVRSTLLWQGGPFMVTGLRDSREVCRSKESDVRPQADSKPVEVSCKRTS
jgi:hypothetical protein